MLYSHFQVTDRQATYQGHRLLIYVSRECRMGSNLMVFIKRRRKRMKHGLKTKYLDRQTEDVLPEQASIGYIAIKDQRVFGIFFSASVIHGDTTGLVRTIRRRVAARCVRACARARAREIVCLCVRAHARATCALPVQISP